MKVKFLKYTPNAKGGKPFQKGQVVEFDKDRAERAIKRGFCVEVKEVKPETEKKVVKPKTKNK